MVLLVHSKLDDQNEKFENAFSRSRTSQIFENGMIRRTIAIPFIRLEKKKSNKKDWNVEKQYHGP